MFSASEMKQMEARGSDPWKVQKQLQRFKDGFPLYDHSDGSPTWSSRVHPSIQFSDPKAPL